MATLTINQAAKNFGYVKALVNVSLDVADGEVLVLVGPSGCGKTTLLRMIAGLEELSAGSVHLGNRDVSFVDPKDRDVAMVFQNYALYPHMTVYGNMAFCLQQRHVPKAEIRRTVMEAARILDLEHLVDRRPGTLSGGQRQRVAMGRAIVRKPAIFLMDEPLSNLDAKLRVQMRAELKLLRAKLGVTTVYVTHDQVEAMTLGDRVAVLAPYSDAGQSNLQQVDTPRVLYEEPCNLFVAGFIGSPAMNFFRVRLIEAGTRLNAEIEGTDIACTLSEANCPQFNALRGYAGQPVVMGIRPEFFAAPTGQPDRQQVDLDILVSEIVGPDAFLHFDLPTPEVQAAFSRSYELDDGGLNAARFTARISTESLKSFSGRISLEINVPKLHFFDPTTTGRIAVG